MKPTDFDSRIEHEMRKGFTLVSFITVNIILIVLVNLLYFVLSLSDSKIQRLENEIQAKDRCDKHYYGLCLVKRSKNEN